MSVTIIFVTRYVIDLVQCITISLDKPLIKSYFQSVMIAYFPIGRVDLDLAPDEQVFSVL